MRSILIRFIGLLLLLPSLSWGQDAEPTKIYAGATDSGFLLPNGWRLTPAGQQVPLSDLPLNILTSPDGKTAFVATSGYNAHELTAINLSTREKTSVQAVPQSWFGLAWDDHANRFWWSGGGQSVLHQLDWSSGQLGPAVEFPSKDDAAKGPFAELPGGFRTGVFFDSAEDSVYSLTIIPRDQKPSAAENQAAVPPGSGAISRVRLGEQPSCSTASCGVRPDDVVRCSKRLAVRQRLVRELCAGGRCGVFAHR